MATRGTNRARLLLVTLLVTSLLLITLDLRGVSLVSSVRGFTQTALTPFQSFGSSLLSPIGQLFSDLFNINNTRERIVELEDENQELKAQDILNEDIQGELKQLKGVLDLAGKAKFRTVSARVISKGGTATISETIVIDQGSKAGIKRDMTVIAASGLVGVVKSTTTNAAVVMLMSDPSFRIGVRIAGSQFMGVLSGEGQGIFSLQMLSAAAQISVGDVLLSRGSSGDAPFVPGVPVGKITFVENAAGQLTKQARVQSFVDLNSIGVVSVVLDSLGNNPGDALVPAAPRPAPTVTVFVTPSPSE
ncbi:MAG: rod shape-determining protein MreC [Candidatus Nanopelagicaceae bacterium]